MSISEPQHRGPMEDWAIRNRAFSNMWTSVYGLDIHKLREAIRAGADVNRTIDSSANTCLHVACDKGWMEGIEELLASGANHLAANKYGYTPLHGVASSGERAAVDLILALPGVDVHASSQVGYTPLMSAAMAPKGDAVRALLAAGARPFDVCKDGYSPVFAAAQTGKEDSLRAFVEADAAVFELLQTDEFWAEVRLAVSSLNTAADDHVARLRRVIAAHAAAVNIEAAMPGDGAAPARSTGLTL